MKVKNTLKEQIDALGLTTDEVVQICRAIRPGMRICKSNIEQLFRREFYGKRGSHIRLLEQIIQDRQPKTERGHAPRFPVDLTLGKRSFRVGIWYWQTP